MSGAYQPPQTSGQGSGAAGSSAFNLASTGLDDSKPTQYACGECDQKVILKKGDAIRCKDCGHRVLYKERTTRMVQFEAR